jgi:ubiquinone/menaquinone biosynthesis C-methylase UbiE
MMRAIKKIVNGSLSPLGVEIVRSQSAFTSQDLKLSDYPISDRPRDPAYLNVGAGQFRHPYWHNIDYLSDAYSDRIKSFVDINLNLMMLPTWPLESNSVNVVYSSHTVEHLTDDAVTTVLSEAARCLKEGGTIRLTCPDAALSYRALVDEDKAFWDYDRGSRGFSLKELFVSSIASALNHPEYNHLLPGDDEFSRMVEDMTEEELCNHVVSLVPLESQQKQASNHLNWFNYGKLSSMLSTAGFSKVNRSGYGQSHHPVLRATKLFDRTHPYMSIYVEATV